VPQAIEHGLRPDALALRLVEMADANSDRSSADFAALAASVTLANGRDVDVLWRRPHVRPEAFLQIPLRWLATEREAPGLWFNSQPAKRDGVERSYERTGAPAAAVGEPRLIVETEFPDDEASLGALMRGDVDVIDRVPPWQLARVANSPNVSVVAYRLPTVHVLIPNQANPLLETREFRRALNYGIDAESIVRDILLGGEARPGFRTLSGPFPAGVALNDPGGYAYNPELAPRPYEPRLAALLAGVARTTLAKRDEEKRKAEAKAEAKEEAAKTPQAEAAGKTAAETPPPTAKDEAAKDPTAGDDDVEKPAPPPAPLILAHSSDPVAKLACQSIKMQLDQIGIPIKLAEFKGGAPPADLKYDLLYAELAIWEPVYDARRLLSSTGVAGRASAMMTAALDQLDRAENWNQARDQLREIHRIAHYDLPLIPLWQTVNHFAHRQSLSGVEANPVTLYQNLPQWRKSIE
jgi:ABC-type transport system substrate-binding protein